MKNVKIHPGVNWHAIQPEYQHDTNIRLNNNNIKSKDGLELNICDAMQSTLDVTTNNQTQLILVDNVKVHDVFKIDVDLEKYPEQFTTYLLHRGFPTYNSRTSYLKILEEASDADTREYVLGVSVVNETSYDTTYFTANVENDNGLYYNITLHDDYSLSINHNDNYENVYMTCRGNPLNGTSEIYFESLTDGLITDDKKFNYILDRDQGYVILYKEFSGNVYYVTPQDTSANETRLNFTPASAATGLDSVPYDSVIRIKANKKQTVTGLDLINTWVSYTTHGDLNRLDINETKTYDDINNNYVLTSPINVTESNTKQYNVLQLKNQTTPDNKQSRHNPFPNFLPCDHRQYDKLFTGTNQINGYQNASFGYNSYVTTLDLPPDNITYFHTPQDMYPYDKININDCGLIESGAIGGDTPMVSDKIFKKAADYKYNTPFGAPLDEETGAWLCSWLKSNTGTEWNTTVHYERDMLVNYENKTYKCIENNVGIQPNLDNTKWEEMEDTSSIWVDRYYNPKHYTATQALQVSGQYVSYTSKFEYIVDKLNAEKHIVFDKQSDLCLEPGCMYAYYRIGDKENDSIIETLQDSLIHEGVNPVYTQDRSLHVNQTPGVFSLSGDHYIETEARNKTNNSDYMISLHINPNDWTQPFASQVIGNYTNEGVGLFNRINTTPYVILIGTLSVDIYNTSMDLINRISVDDQPVKVLHLEGSENLYIYTDTNIIYQYDIKGMLVEKFQLPVEHNIIDVEIDNECIYTLDDTNFIRKYDLNDELQDELYDVWPNNVLGTGTSPTGDPFVTSPNTYIVPFDDLQYRVNCDCYTMDMSGNMWFVKENKVFQMIPDEQQGINATFVDSVNGKTISLITQERNLGATRGNSIVIVANGSDTLDDIIRDWNETHPSNRIETLSFDSLDLVLPAGYTIQFSGGVDRGTTTVTYGMSGNIGHDIINIKSDEHDNLWLLSQQNEKSYIYKFNTERKMLFCSCLSSIDTSLQYAMSGDCHMDLITEFTSGGFVHDVLILNKPIDTNWGDVDENIEGMLEDNKTKVTRINTYGELVGSYKKPVKAQTARTYKSYINTTNFDPLKNLYKHTIQKNHLIFKMRYRNYFDTDKTFTRRMMYDVSELSSGSHHIMAGFNSFNGNLALFVDGQLQCTAVSEDSQTGAGYRQTKTIHSPLYVGSDTFFNNITLSEHLGLKNYNFAGDCDITGLRVYNDYLDFHRVKALARENQNIQPITLTLPTGKRSYLDQVTKFYHHRIPGRRSTKFDVNIITQALSGDTTTQEVVTSNVATHIDGKLPVNTTINEINWIS